MISMNQLEEALAQIIQAPDLGVVPEHHDPVSDYGSQAGYGNFHDR
jgi:hypothetical protein